MHPSAPSTPTVYREHLSAVELILLGLIGMLHRVSILSRRHLAGRQGGVSDLPIRGRTTSGSSQAHPGEPYRRVEPSEPRNVIQEGTRERQHLPRDQAHGILRSHWAVWQCVNPECESTSIHSIFRHVRTDRFCKPFAWQHTQPSRTMAFCKLGPRLSPCRNRQG